VIGSSAVLGAAIGSFAGGKLIQYGRRKMMIIFNAIGIIAVLMTLVLNVYSICFGRLLFGFCGGIFGVALPRMIEETIPQNLLGPFGVVTNLSVNTGSLVAILVGAILPDPSTDPTAAASTNLWRVVFGLPLVF
jgi:MFS family permease